MSFNYHFSGTLKAYKAFCPETAMKPFARVALWTAGAAALAAGGVGAYRLADNLRNKDDGTTYRIADVHPSPVQRESLGTYGPERTRGREIENSKWTVYFI